ncbi:two-component regulator propeller domain-containing protein [Sphingobacterium sp. LRF_L2]|uniref:two-component regulator propeller domain-containing protein n=1 Tax=Sphingobacterium sp. LRF_L2 TaxID=3369421 RepID=UPI003F5ED4D0
MSLSSIGRIMFLLFFLQYGYAQEKVKLNFYTGANGLSHHNVSSIVKDKDGFMWFGTWNGINRFDGYTFKNFSQFSADDMTYLESRRVSQLLDGSDNKLWIVSYNKGVYWFDKVTETFHSLSKILEKRFKKRIFIEKILALDTAYIWLRTENLGLIAVSQKNPEEHIQCFDVRGEQSSRIFSNEINILHQDQDQNYWVTTDRGISLLASGKGKLSIKRLAENPTEGRSITKISEDECFIAFAGASNKLVLYDKKHEVFRVLEIGNVAINDIFFSKSGKHLYLTNVRGELWQLHIASGQQTVVYSNTGPLYAIYEDFFGNIWLEHEGPGVTYLDRKANKSQKFFPPTTHFSGSVGFRCFEDFNRTIWISMKGGGFGYFDPVSKDMRFETVDIQGKMSELPQYNYNVFYDSDGVAWFCSEEDGLVKMMIQQADFQQVLLPEFQNQKRGVTQEVRSLLSDRYARLWIGMKNGDLYMLKDGKYSKPKFLNVPRNGLGAIYALLEDRRGNIWIGTKDKGLHKAIPIGDGPTDTYRLEHYNRENGLLNATQIYFLVEDNKDVLWVGTFDEGLFKLEENFGHTGFKEVLAGTNALNGQNKIKVRHMALDESGNLWTATTTGLFVYDGAKKSKHFVNNAETEFMLGDNDIQYIFSGSKGNMWLCTAGGGLIKVSGDPFEKPLFTKYGAGEGLSNGFILSCVVDATGNLLLATEGGIVRFDTARGRFFNVDANVHFAHAGFSEKVVVKLNTDEIIWGTTKGLLIYKNKNSERKSNTPPLVFTKLLVNSEEWNPRSRKGMFNIQYLDRLLLSHNQNNLSIDFAVNNHNANHQNFYYRLVGLDSSWHQNGAINRASFTNLKPGEYVFEVKCETDLYSTMPFKRILIVVSPPWWASWWAYVCYVLILSLAIWIVKMVTKSMLHLKQKVLLEKRLANIKMDFFTNISHELRTPLTLIATPIDQLLKEKGLSADGKKYVQMVKNNATRMGGFVDQLLELRRIQEDKYVLRPRLVDVVDLVKSTRDSFAVYAAELNIRLIFLTEIDVLPLWIDREKIEIVLCNLLSNALKYAPADTKVEITLSLDKKEQRIYLAVKDQGPGIADDALLNIFDLFYVGHESAKDGMKSTGVGLALSRELILLHHGTIEAKNAKPTGLIVTFTLPVVEQAELLPIVDEVNLSLGKIDDEKEGGNRGILTEDILVSVGDHDEKGKVLIVEDNSDLRTFLALQLKEHYEVILAEDGEIGYEMAVSRLPELIISDIMMPKLDGISLLRQLRSNPQTSHIPIVLLSAKHAIESKMEGVTYGADLYMTKPFHMDYLMASVRNILERRKTVVQAIVAKKTIIPTASNVVLVDKDEEFLRTVLAIVEEKMIDPTFTIDTVAETLALSRNSFYNKFKSLTNQAPVEFVRDIRLQKAVMYLKNGGYNITEVAYKVGFKYPKYFSTCFKEKYGCSPKEFLQKQIEV